MDDTSVGWEGMAAWLDEKHGDEGDVTHRALIDPAIFRLLGVVDGQEVLDLACGNGYFARKLARSGARVTGVDASAPIIERARRREAEQPLGIIYHVADAAHLDMLAAASFAVVVCNMALMDIADVEGAFREVTRVLQAGGRFIASLSHPCFDVPGASAWVVERMQLTTTIWRKVSRYREPFSDWCVWQVGPDRFWRTPAYHRPLSWYFRALRTAGFVVTAFEEPEPTQEFLAESQRAEWHTLVPLYAVIEACKSR